MKKVVLILIVCLLLLASNVFAADVSIDQDGNITTGLSSSGNLEVIGSSGEDGIIGSTSGTGASGVLGENTTYGNFGIIGGFYDIYDVGVYGYSSSGFAGYFEGDIRVTGNLTTYGMIESTNGGIKFPDGTIQTSAGTGQGSSGKKITAVYAGMGLLGGGTSGEVTLDVDFTGAGIANTVARSDHNHNLFYSSISHDHSGSDIISGTISEPRIDSSIARSNEIIPTVLNNDGENSGIDADKLDGHDSSDFLSTSSDYGRSGVASNLYEDDQTLTSKYVNASGDSMTGVLTVAGTIQSTSGGIKFPDGTTQTTAVSTGGFYNRTCSWGAYGHHTNWPLIGSCEPPACNGSDANLGIDCYITSHQVHSTQLVNGIYGVDQHTTVGSCRRVCGR